MIDKALRLVPTFEQLVGLIETDKTKIKLPARYSFSFSDSALYEQVKDAEARLGQHGTRVHEEHVHTHEVTQVATETGASAAEIRTIMRNFIEVPTTIAWNSTIIARMAEATQEDRKKNFLHMLRLKSPSEEDLLLPMFLMPYHIEHPDMTTLTALGHYVHCFPFYETKADVNEVTPPNFMMTKRSGNNFEHAIMLACTMMGMKDDPVVMAEHEERRQQYLKQVNRRDDLAEDGNEADENEVLNYVPIRDRVFVCIGLIDKPKTKEYWTMTYSADLKDVTFWDPRQNLSFKLPGRVEHGERRA